MLPLFSLMFSLAAAAALHPESVVPQTPEQHEFTPPQGAGLLLDRVDKLPLLIGPTTPQAILAHRSGFSEAYEKAQIPPDLVKRWEAIEVPCTLVAVFGSWCSDSYHWVPDLIKLSETPNPYISIHWIGVSRNKSVKRSHWPAQSIPKKTRKVPTFWLFKPTPGGKTKLAGRIIENPPKIDQTMAEALVELLESALL